MSLFEVKVKTIARKEKHSNADRLKLYYLDNLGYQFISNVDYNVGDTVVYFPVDSIMTPELIELFGLGTMLAGKNNNRVKTVRLRGEYSQGFIADTKSVANFLSCSEQELEFINLTEKLGIVKYEPPPVLCKAGDLVALPPTLSMYDIEGCDNYLDIIQYIIDNKIKVTITEKIEGQNFSTTVDNEQVYVSQRRFSIKEKEGVSHTMWDVARDNKIIDTCNSIKEQKQYDDVTLYGEFYGPSIQGNYYGVQKRDVLFFDMKINGAWVDDELFRRILKEYGLGDKIVPTLAEDVYLDEWLDGRAINVASNGKSALNSSKLREGIVIKPTKEYNIHGFGRLILKQRDPEYLGKTDF